MPIRPEWVRDELDRHWQPWGYVGYQRTLPDGRNAVLNTWQNGDGEGGWTLTINYETTKYGTLTEALGAVEQKILEDR
jgi:hypothetical protein